MHNRQPIRYILIIEGEITNMKESIDFSLTVNPSNTPPPNDFTVLDANSSPVQDGASVFLNDETVGVADSQTVCTLKGGTAPYNVVLTAGALPDGISLNSTVNSDGSETLTIDGTPTTAGPVDFSLDVSDSAGATQAVRAIAMPTLAQARRAVPAKTRRA